MENVVRIMTTICYNLPEFHLPILMKVILLAGGKSVRLQPLNDKVLFEFLGKPLICHQVDLLREHGLEDIIIVASENNVEVIQQLVRDVKVVIQKEATGMKGALVACREIVGNEACLIVSSNDILEGGAYDALLETIQKTDPDGAILSRQVDSYFPGGYMELDGKSNRIKSIVEKPEPGSEPSSLINLVVHYHKNAQLLYGELDKAQSENDDLYEVALDALFQSKNYQAVPYSGFWQAIKYPWHILDASNYFLSKIKEPKISPNANIAESAIVKGPVIIEDGVKVFEYAVIAGPCYIGKNSVVANHTLVRESIINENCVVGFSTEVARSYLRNNIWSHSNYIGDSIIDNNVSFGAGTVTGNLRLDEKDISMEIKGSRVSAGRNKLGAIIGENVRVGVNSSIMPGIKIGKNSFIGASMTLAQNVKDNSFVRIEQSIKESENKMGSIGNRDSFS